MPFPTAPILNASGGPLTVNTLPNAGQNTKAESLGVTIASDDDIQGKLGGLTETAPASDTASSGLNGRLQRIAQRITSLIAQIPATLGQHAAAASMSVVHATDDPAALALGTTTDAVLATGNAGTALAYLRTIMEGVISTASSSVKFDQTTDGTTNRIAVGNSPPANTAKSYTGTFVVAATALTRPANVTAYTALDSISNNATAASVTANSVSLSDTNDHPIDISEILLATTDTGPGTAAIQIRVHLFNSDPTASTGVVGGDNAAWSNKQAGWVGSFSGTMRAFSDGSRGIMVADEGTLRLISPVSGAKTLFWQLETLGAFTPSANSTTFTPTFKGFQARPA